MANQDVTDEQRELISKHFTSHNANIKMGGKYVLPTNVHAQHGSIEVSFRNEKGKLKASVNHWDSASDRRAGSTPVTSSQHEINGEADIIKIKKLSKS